MFNFSIFTTIAHFVQQLVASLITWCATLFTKPQPVPVAPARPKARKSALPQPTRPMLFLPLLEQKDMLQPAGAGPAINPLYLPVLVKKEPAKPVRKSNRTMSNLSRLISG